MYLNGFGSVFIFSVRFGNWNSNLELSLINIIDIVNIINIINIIIIINIINIINIII